MSTSPLSYDEIARRGGETAMRQLGRFFMGDDPVFKTLRNIGAKLEDIGVPYAVAGGVAVNAHGLRRGTLDVDVIVTSEGLKKLHEELEGLGYVAPFAGSKNLWDTETTVRVKFRVSGQFPGDGKPKPVAFPDPADVAVDIGGIKYLSLPSLIELKLASGMTNRGRMKDFGDVQELVRELKLPREFASKLNPFVRSMFESLWDGVAEGSRQEP